MHACTTYDDGNLLVWLGKRIRAVSGPDDQGAMHGCPEKRLVSVPPQGAFLLGDIEPVGEVLVGLDGTLGDHRHPVVPAVPPLPHTMPTHI
jgi:hypothetical protein